MRRDRVSRLSPALVLLAVGALASTPVTLAGFGARTTSPNDLFTDLVVQPATLAAPSTFGGGAVRLTWTASPTASTETVNYAVMRSPAGLASWTQVASLIGLTYDDVPPADGSWDYEVQSIVTLFTADSGVVTGLSDRTPPTVPTGLTAATGTSRGSVALTWTASSDAGSGMQGYSVQYVRSTSCPAASSAGYPTATSLITTTSTTITGLSTAKTYCFYVVATDNAGNTSAPSNVASAKAK